MTSDDGADDPSIDSLLRDAARIPQAPVERHRAGDTIDRYRLVSELGRGGMGVVYEAEDVQLSRRVAVKVLPRSAVEDDERRRRFLREARAAAALSHPNLVAVHDVGEIQDGTVFIAMELVRGATLRATISAHPTGLAPSEAIAIGRQVARAVGHAHASGIVHRDLKPDNVMVDENGVVKIVDFGLARLLAAPAPSPSGGDADLSTQDGKILGTPSYMAPEQAKSAKVGPPADVFSIGVVLYELLTGARPFAGENVVDVLVSVARDDVRPPSRRAPRIPRAVDGIVMKCLAKDAADRFRDANDLADALEHALDVEPVRARRVVVVASLLSVLIGAGAIALSSARTPPAPARSEMIPASVQPPAAPTSGVPSASSTVEAPSAVASSSAPRSAPPPRSSVRVSASAAIPRVPVDPLAHQK